MKLNEPSAQAPAEDLHCLDHAIDPHAVALLRDAGLLVVGREPAGADPELDPSARQHVERGDLLGQHHRVLVVVVEHERADPQIVVASAAAIIAGTGASWSPKWSGMNSVL